MSSNNITYFKYKRIFCNFLNRAGVRLICDTNSVKDLNNSMDINYYKNINIYFSISIEFTLEICEFYL